MTAQTHAQLFDLYVAELTIAREKALHRLAGRMATWTRRLGSEARAREKLDADAPPCTDTRVVAVIRAFWLRCDALNRQNPAVRVEPRDFLLAWLKTARPILAAFLEPLPYWPMGKNENGEWV